MQPAKSKMRLKFFKLTLDILVSEMKSKIKSYQVQFTGDFSKFTLHFLGLEFSKATADIVGCEMKSKKGDVVIKTTAAAHEDFCF